MKQANKAKWATCLFALALMGIVSGCEKEVYNPDNNKTKLPPAEDYPDFTLRGDVQLSVDYNAPGFKTLIEVYDQNPMQEDGKNKKEGVQPIYAAYTDADGKLTSRISIPTAVTEAYLYTDRWGLPKCVKLEANASGWTYDGTISPRPATKASVGGWNYLMGDKAPYLLSDHTADNLYSMGLFDQYGYMDNYAHATYTSGYITQTTTYKNEAIGDISLRAQSFFYQYEGKKVELLKPASVTNIKVVSEGSVDVVFLTENAEYHNTFGYYYYEAGKAPTTEAELKAMKKYIVVPAVDDDGSSSTTTIRPGNTFKLKYFGKDGVSVGVDKFPANTVIGWFIVSNGWISAGGGVLPWVDSPNRSFFLSNDRDQNMRFVAVKDDKTGIVVLGCEDQPEKLFNRETEDYQDLLFFIKSDDAKIDNEGKPLIPDPDGPVVLPDGNFSVVGTLAFEDIWPNGGDYDLNDVIIEYNRDVIFNANNEITKIADTFKSVQPENSAKQDNFFACQYPKLGKLGNLPDGVTFENETNSIVLTADVRKIVHTSYTIERDMSGMGLVVTGTGDKSFDDGFNPYIIPKAYTTKDRVEIHLPKHAMTSAGKEGNMTGDNAYYIDTKSRLPFAINIPITGFKPADEKIAINSDDQYPEFAKWASDNSSNTDWYTKGKAK